MVFATSREIKRESELFAVFATCHLRTGQAKPSDFMRPGCASAVTLIRHGLTPATQQEVAGFKSGEFDQTEKVLSNVS
jgi:hypothetical protein